jgi:hypothetical protein
LTLHDHCVEGLSVVYLLHPAREVRLENVSVVPGDKGSVIGGQFSLGHDEGSSYFSEPTVFTVFAEDLHVTVLLRWPLKARERPLTRHEIRDLLPPLGGHIMAEAGDIALIRPAQMKGGRLPSGRYKGYVVGAHVAVGIEHVEGLDVDLKKIVLLGHRMSSWSR